MVVGGMVPTGAEARTQTGKEIRVFAFALRCGEVTGGAGAWLEEGPVIAWTSCSDTIFPQLETRVPREARPPHPQNQIHSLMKWQQPQAGFQLLLCPQVPGGLARHVLHEAPPLTGAD